MASCEILRSSCSLSRLIAKLIVHRVCVNRSPRILDLVDNWQRGIRASSAGEAALLLGSQGDHYEKLTLFYRKRLGAGAVRDVEVL